MGKTFRILSALAMIMVLLCLTSCYGQDNSSGISCLTQGVEWKIVKMTEDKTGDAVDLGESSTITFGADGLFHAVGFFSDYDGEKCTRSGEHFYIKTDEGATELNFRFEDGEYTNEDAKIHVNDGYNTYSATLKNTQYIQ